ncbi:16S rRNA (cytosine(1402)-N(4))-methyltransferase RsmH [Candidatus Gottesmanbacteria bacterium]|nr:16S rRNA (cytosine(1402)-N(4))-methyltransferase RsmH [Candidatus Gottesmanbacteria bacterium]
MNTFHTPVMLSEVVEGLEVTPGKRYIDATVGGGGHGIEILNRGGKLLGIDADPDAIKYAIENAKCQMPNAKWGEDVKIVQGNFRDIERIANENGFSKVDGVLFDLGVSSHQLDIPERGFSYRFADALLDLRMNQSEGESAATLLQRNSREELYEILATFGEEELARPIAHALVGARRVKPIETTGALTAVIDSVVPKAQREKTLSRVFQAIRIAVNDELTALRVGLTGAANVLTPGGRLAVISFHSLEDRIVKGFFRERKMKNMTKKPIRPTENEIRTNKRAGSAKLRIAVNL